MSLAMGIAEYAVLMLFGGVAAIVLGEILLRPRAEDRAHRWQTARRAVDDVGACRRALGTGTQLGGVVRRSAAGVLDAPISGQWCVAFRADFGYATEDGSVDSVGLAPVTGCVPFVLEHGDGSETQEVTLEGDIRFAPAVGAGRRFLRASSVERPPPTPEMRAYWAQIVGNADQDPERFRRMTDQHWETCVGDAMLCAGIRSEIWGFGVGALSDQQLARGGYVEWVVAPGDVLVIAGGDQAARHQGGPLSIRNPWIIQGAADIPNDFGARLEELEQLAEHRSGRARHAHLAAVALRVAVAAGGVVLMVVPFVLLLK